ncbi:carbon storage regulator CsrA [Pseudomonas lurida]
MLVISRRSKERIRIGEAITIKLIKVDENSVLFGITAPSNVKIDNKPSTKSSFNKNISVDGDI